MIGCGGTGSSGKGRSRFRKSRDVGGIQCRVIDFRAKGTPGDGGRNQKQIDHRAALKSARRVVELSGIQPGHTRAAEVTQRIGGIRDGQENVRTEIERAGQARWQRGERLVSR